MAVPSYSGFVIRSTERCDFQMSVYRISIHHIHISTVCTVPGRCFYEKEIMSPVYTYLLCSAMDKQQGKVEELILLRHFSGCH